MAEAEPDPAAQRALVEALRRQLGAQLIETHISYVLLAGAHAYKLKKALDLGFVDLRVLGDREAGCREELRLNRRTAPELYLEVLPIGGTPAQPRLGGDGPAIEWALHMRAFDQDGLWDRLARQGKLNPAHIDALVGALCALHERADTAAAGGPFGQPEQLRAPVSDTLRELDRLCRAAGERAALARLAPWEAQAFAALRDCFVRRQREGRVRDLHGDLHLGNVTQVEGHTRLFDGLEFSAELRWGDVFSDVAFMAMDLHAHGLARLAHRFVNAYVERSGDADGLQVLRYYHVYRALVRAKVAALRAAQLGGDATALQALHRYLGEALRASQPAPPVLLLTHGFSGSGKTALTHSLLELCGALRFRADVERKRLFGLDALASSDAALKPRLYGAQANRDTLARLLALARLALQAGHAVILDATFLAFEARQQARELAAALGVRCVLIDFQARVQTLRQRVQGRRGDASEADLALLERQLAEAAPLTPQERADAFVFDAEPALDPHGMRERWAPLLRRLGREPAGA